MKALLTQIRLNQMDLQKFSVFYGDHNKFFTKTIYKLMMNKKIFNILELNFIFKNYTVKCYSISN